MYASNEIIELIKSFEGFRETPYFCPSGYKTIGYGHNLGNQALEKINQEEAELLLIEDIAQAENAVMRNIKVLLTQNQFDALVSFTFNLGSAALQRSTLRQKVNRSEHEDVPKEFKRWVFAGGKISPGLIARREVEARLYG